MIFAKRRYAMTFSVYPLLIPVFFLISIVLAAFILRGPKKVEYSKLDRAGVITNIILSILYVPISAYGVLSIFALDAPHGYAATITIQSLINIGLTLPILSVICIAISVRFRRSGHSVISFCIQFIPLTVFAIVAIGFMTV